MKRWFFWAFSACLAVCLAGCGNNDAPDIADGGASMAISATAATAEPAEEMATGGAVHMVTRQAADGYYGAGYVYDKDLPGSCLYKIDYTAATATPLCNRPGCTHDTADCHAWEMNYSGGYQIFADGDNIYRFYGQKLIYWGDDKLDAAMTEVPEEKRGPHLEVQSAEGGAPTMLATLDRDDLENVSLLGMAADEEFLYLDLNLSTSETDGTGNITSGMVHTLTAVPKAGGAPETLYTWPHTWSTGGAERQNYPEKWPTLLAVQGRQLIFCVLENSADTGTQTGGYTQLYDLDTRQWQDGFTWKNVGSYGYNGSDNAAWTNYVATGWSPAAVPAPLLHYDTVAGTIAALDPLTGAETPLCSALPAQTETQIAQYSVQPLGDWLAVEIRIMPLDENRYTLDTGGDTTGAYHQLYLVPAEGGQATRIELYQYVTARGTDPIQLLDAQNGQFLCHFGYTEESYTGVDKDGSPMTYSDITDHYGMIGQEDLLASRPNYQEITAG